MVAAPDRGALRLVSLDPLAQAAGLTVGLAVTDARAMHPDLIVHEAMPEADHALHIRLADAARRFTPLVALAGEGSISPALMLDITGAAHLFGGEAGLMGEAVARLGAPHRPVQAALAGTPGAALALALHRPGAILPTGREAEALDALPLSALRLPQDAVAGLGRVGVKRIGDLAALPRAPLAARFGTAVLRCLDRAMGREEEPITPRLPTGPYLAERRFADPIGREGDVLAAIGRLARTLSGMLTSHGEGARRLEVALFRTDGQVRCIDVGVGRPTRDEAFIGALFAERIGALADPLDPGFGYDMIRLSVLEAERIEAGQARLDGGPDPQSLARLVDRLGARLGPGQVRHLAPRDSRVPEMAQAAEAASRPRPGEGQWPQPPAAGSPLGRPLRLFDRPERLADVDAAPGYGPPLRFHWRARTRHMVAAEGPERIAPPWWQGASPEPARDYWRVEDEEGLRFWVFRRVDPGVSADAWFIHGLFA